MNVQAKREVDCVNRTIVSRCNKAFFIAAMMAEMQGVAFEDALYRGLHQPVTYPFMHAGYPCRMVVNVVALHDAEDVTFLTNLKKAAVDAIDRIPLGICGDLNDKMQIESGPYRFEFRITGYWCEKSPITQDPADLPVGQQFGRQVELRIGLAA